MSAPIYKTDQDNVGLDGATPFVAYVQTRTFKPAGTPSKLSTIRESYVVAGASPGVTIILWGDRNFQIDWSYGTVDLTPVGSELRVIRKFDRMQISDLQHLDLMIGDVAEVDSYWSIELVHAIIEPGGEA